VRRVNSELQNKLASSYGCHNINIIGVRDFSSITASLHIGIHYSISSYVPRASGQYKLLAVTIIYSIAEMLCQQVQTRNSENQVPAANE
jgi:hypothetical protein